MEGGGDFSQEAIGRHEQLSLGQWGTPVYWLVYLHCGIPNQVDMACSPYYGESSLLSLTHSCFFKCR